jgi:acyl dehydratase
MPFDRSVVGRTFGPQTFSYDWQRAALYALACGATETELDLLLETRGPKVLPTFSVVPTFAPLLEALVQLGGNMLTLVHGAQRCVLHAPIPPSGTLHTTARVDALYDKGKGALAIVHTATTSEDGAALFDTEWQIFYRGEGGFGGERGPDAPSYAPPEGKAPDHSVEMPTRATQALLYRLASGDLNPIHSDPSIAAAAGFPRPILHGLASFGHAGRAVLNTLLGGQVERLRSIEGRFTKPVFPGDTLVTDLHVIGEGEAYFTTREKSRGDVVLSLGRVTYAP